jgi:hypothetical protein
MKKNGYDPFGRGTTLQMREDRRNPEHECGAKRNGGVSDSPRVNDVFWRLAVHTKRSESLKKNSMLCHLPRRSIQAVFLLGTHHVRVSADLPQVPSPR